MCARFTHFAHPSTRTYLHCTVQCSTVQSDPLKWKKSGGGWKQAFPHLSRVFDTKLQQLPTLKIKLDFSLMLLFFRRAPLTLVTLTHTLGCTVERQRSLLFPPPSSSSCKQDFTFLPPHVFCEKEEEGGGDLEREEGHRQTRREGRLMKHPVASHDTHSQRGGRLQLGRLPIFFWRVSFALSPLLPPPLKKSVFYLTFPIPENTSEEGRQSLVYGILFLVQWNLVLTSMLCW